MAHSSKHGGTAAQHTRKHAETHVGELTSPLTLTQLHTKPSAHIPDPLGGLQKSHEGGVGVGMLTLPEILPSQELLGKSPQPELRASPGRSPGPVRIRMLGWRGGIGKGRWGGGWQKGIKGL